MRNEITVEYNWKTIIDIIIAKLFKNMHSLRYIHFDNQLNTYAECSTEDLAKYY